MQLRDRSEINAPLIKEKNRSDLEDFSAAGIASYTCKGKSSRDEWIFPSRSGAVIFGRSLKWLLIIFMILIAPVAASIIKRPPTKSTELKFHELKCSDDERGHIHEIVSTIAEYGKLSLLFKQSHLKELGSRINHVHPLRFLAVIFADPYLKSCMFYVWDDYFKRTHFLEGLGPSLTREAESGKLHAYLEDFAAEINTPAVSIKPFFDAHDWESLIYFLIQ